MGNKLTQPNLDIVLEFLYKTAPTTNVNKTEIVSFALREMEVSKKRGDKYFVAAMKMEENFRRACIILGLEELNRLLRPSIESIPTRRPLRIGGESGAEYIHRLLNAHPDLFKEQLRLHRDGKKVFQHPPTGKYYLVDSGYPNTTGYLSPIKNPNVRYHIPDFKKKRVLRGMSEQFNYRHPSSRTTIERVFGNLKKRWKILYTMPQMEDTYQVYVIVPTFTLHNSIRMCKLGIPISEHDVNIQGRVDNDLLNTIRKEAMNKVRKEITLRIWCSIPSNIELEGAALQQEENIEHEATCNKKTQATWELIWRNKKSFLNICDNIAFI
ncbi:hypothetical protein OROMI_007013 [Orobanche minor]